MTTTQTKWAARVAAWRTSGQTVLEFCKGREFSPGGLRYWSSRLGRAEQPGFLRLVPKARAEQMDAEVVIEVRHARVRVKAGFDATLLAEVVAALSGHR